jgi:hypothetical protein
MSNWQYTTFLLGLYKNACYLVLFYTSLYVTMNCLINVLNKPVGWFIKQEFYPFKPVLSHKIVCS